MNKRLLWLISLLMLSGCAIEPMYDSKTSNPKVDVALLFEHDGCKVYRFHDAEYRRYYVNCERNSSTSTIHSSGNTSFPESIHTGYGE